MHSARKTHLKEGKNEDVEKVNERTKAAMFVPWNRKIKKTNKSVRLKRSSKPNQDRKSDVDLVQQVLETVRGETSARQQSESDKCFDEVFNETFVEDYNQIFDSQLREEAARLQLARGGRLVPPPREDSLHGSGAHCLEFSTKSSKCFYQGPWESSRLGGILSNPEINTEMVVPRHPQEIGGPAMSSPSLYKAPHPLLQNSKPKTVQKYLDSILKTDQQLRGLSLLKPNASSIVIPTREEIAERLESASKLRKTIDLRRVKSTPGDKNERS